MVEKAGADWIHFDVMDGNFVPNISFGALIADAVNKVTDLPLDVHLMILHPEKYIDEFRRAGADWITVHIETVDNPRPILRNIRNSGAKAGITLNPETPLSAIKPHLNQVDLVLVMSVHPGFGGQSFIPESLDKVRELVKLRAELKTSYLISLDGGVGEKNARQIAEAGADVIVAGNAIFKANNPARALENIKKKSGFPPARVSKNVKNR
jgi:ribulose-phosphate 3-epimerase